jgi:hypothetical protein
MSADKWYRLEVDWQTDGTHTVTLYNDTGGQVTQLSTTDSTWTDGGIGLFGRELNSGANVYVDEVIIDSRGSSQSTDPSETEIAIDDFEDGTLNEYSVYREGPATLVSSPTYSGSQALAIDQTATDVVSMAGLPYYPQAGDTFSTRVRWTPDANGVIFAYGVQTYVEYSDFEYYYILIKPDADQIALKKWDNDTKSKLDKNLSVGMSADTWYELEVDWQTDGTHTVTLYDDSGAQVSQLSAVDTAYSSGGLGFFGRELNSGATVYFDDAKVTTDDAASYEFSVNGLLSKGSDVESADTVSGGTATGTVEAGQTDTYHFSGELLSFDLEGDAELTVDDEPFDSQVYPQDVLTLESDDAEYDISVSGALEQSTAYNASIDADDTVTGSSASGSLNGDRDSYAFASEAVYYDTTGSMTVYLNGSQLNVEESIARFNQPHGLVVDAKSSDPADYSFSVAGGDVVVGPNGDYASGDIADGTVNGGTDDYFYAGKVEYLTDNTTIYLVNDFDASGGPTATVDPLTQTPAGGVSYEITVTGDVSASTTNGRSSSITTDSDGNTVFSSTVYPSDSHSIDYSGDVVGFDQPDYTVTMFRDEYRDEAIDSAKLQLAAEQERASEFDLLSADADTGRIRRDPKGLNAIRVRGNYKSSVVARDTVEFRLTDLPARTKSGLGITENKDDGSIKLAALEYTTLTSDGYVESVEVREASSGSVSVDTIHPDVNQQRQVAQSYSSAGILEDAVTTASDAVLAGISEAVNQAADIAEATPEEATDQVKRIDDAVGEAVRKGATGIDLLYAAAETGFAEELADGDGQLINCTSTVAFASTVCRAQVCGIGGSAACGAIGIVSGPAGTIGCVALVSVFCEQAIEYADNQGLDSLPCGDGSLIEGFLSVDPINIC